jgi:hypothetical protein
MVKLTKKQREERARRIQRASKKMDADRVARGVCRHCGGEVPCYSPWGDVAVGKRRPWTFSGKGDE